MEWYGRERWSETAVGWLKWRWVCVESAKKTSTKKVRQCIPLLSWKVREGVKTIGSCFRLTKWKNVVATKIIGVEPGSSARASNSLTTASQCLICFDKLVLLYQNHLLCDVTLAGRHRLKKKKIEPPPSWSKLFKAVTLRWWIRCEESRSFCPISNKIK